MDDVKITMEQDKDFGQKINPVPRPEKNIGVDLNSNFYDNIIQAGLNSTLNISDLNSLTQVSERRNDIYKMLDVMAQDSTVNAIIETMAEDATETNELGYKVWAESTDTDIQNFITFLLETTNIDKQIYDWAVSLITYGDFYIKLFRNSEYEDPLFKKNNKVKYDNNDTLLGKGERSQLKEDINLKAYKVNDHYSHYIEMASNPAELFELMKLGKTQGFAKTYAPVTDATQPYGSITNNVLVNKYYFKKSDVDLYEATEYVHGCLGGNISRTPEEINIFLDDNTDGTPYTYKVRRGQSMLYPVFKTWRSLTLQKNSMLLNRLTKSSIVRVINIEVGDMPKEMVGPQLTAIKQLIEQKTALNAGTSIEEYTNPGPVENNVYIPTHGGVGALSTQQIGGDVDVKGISDIDYFDDELFGAFGVPKQYFGRTDDGAGFNGGQSLTIISSRYAKKVKKIQAVLCQVVTDIINLMLIDKGLDSYINKFTIKMLSPTTQEELDRQQASQTKIQSIGDLMNLLGDIEDPIIKLKILKAILSNTITNDEVIQYIQEEIERLEKEAKGEMEEGLQERGDTDKEDIDVNMNFGGGRRSGGIDNDTPLNLNDEIDTETPESEGPEIDSDSDTLPSANDLNMNFADYEG